LLPFLCSPSDPLAVDPACVCRLVCVVNAGVCLCVACVTCADLNGDGTVSLQEMTTYLRSVFRVMQALEPESFTRLGLSPDEIAAATAEKCFEDADTNKDGSLSFEEFKAWYSVGSSPAAPARSASTGASQGRSSSSSSSSGAPSASGGLSLQSVRDILGLSKFSVADLIEVFASEVDGEVCTPRFECGFFAVCSGPGAVRPVTGSSFGCVCVWGGGGGGHICRGNAACGPFVERACFAPCGPLRIDVCACQGNVSRESFEYVFGKIMRGSEVEHHASTQYVLSHLFDIFDLDHSGSVDFTELSSGLSILCGGDAQEKIHAAFMLYGAWPGGKSGCGREGGGRNVRGEGGGVPTAVSLGARARAGNPLREPACCCLHCRPCCRHNPAAAMQFPPACPPDFDGDGFISMDEMQTYLASVFKMLYATQPDTMASTGGLSPHDLAAATAAECFAEADADGDGRLTYEEFSRFCLSGGLTSPGPVAAGAGSGASPMKAVVLAATQARPSWLSTDEIRRLTNLGAFSVEDVFAVFASEADADNRLDRAAFARCFHLFLVEELSHDDAERHRLVLTRLFDVFDANGDGYVDLTELSSGISFLAGGSKGEKVQAAFALYDLDGDGFIDREEMFAYLSAVFRVMYEGDPSIAARTQVDPETLARDTTDLCFQEADTDGDGRLSLQVPIDARVRAACVCVCRGRCASHPRGGCAGLAPAAAHAWCSCVLRPRPRALSCVPPAQEFASYYNLEGDGTRGAIRERVVNLAAEPPSWVSLAEIKRITQLGSYTLAEVADSFLEHADGEGKLTRPVFNDVFRRLMRLGAHSGGCVVM
jgi:Ca2+-binding EF-hand superfamily protein